MNIAVVIILLAFVAVVVVVVVVVVCFCYLFVIVIVIVAVTVHSISSQEWLQELLQEFSTRPHPRKALDISLEMFIFVFEFLLNIRFWLTTCCCL